MLGNLQNVTDASFKLNTIEEAIEDIKAGKLVVVVDDEDRENEGDFICAAECVTPEIINFMSKYGRGLICTPIDEARAKELELDMMVSSNTAVHETAFTISIDLIGQGCTTGISAYDRATGIRALVNPKTKPADFARPGHIFPLKAKTGGVLRRTGHTEAAIDLARLAGFSPAGVLVEILDDDGSAARLPRLMDVAKEHGLKIIAIKDLVAFRMKTERLIEKEVSVTIETKKGEFEVSAYRQLTTDDIHLAIKKGSWKPDEPVLVRVHSSTETSDALGSLFDNVGQSLQRAVDIIGEEGVGLVLFIRHGEKKDSILQKLKSLDKNNQNGDTVDTTIKETQQKDFGVGAQILRDQDITKIRLLSQNVTHRVALSGYGLEIVERVQL
jgi:3,4-dihydroxy 2-butanone 4-phosphate synthase/GTP cyclohydrolase II